MVVVTGLVTDAIIYSYTWVSIRIAALFGGGSSSATVAAVGGSVVSNAGKIVKLPVPAIPAMFKNVSQFGKAIKWGLDTEMARAEISNITKGGMDAIGVTREIAAEWAVFYVNEMTRNPGNPSAQGRAELMMAIMNLFE